MLDKRLSWQGGYFHTPQSAIDIVNAMQTIIIVINAGVETVLIAMEMWVTS